MGLLKRLILFPILAVCFDSKSYPASSVQLSGQSEVRHDIRSGTNARQQYRLRLYSKLNYDQWSVSAFAATGDDFDSSHNTFVSGEPVDFNLRHLFISRSEHKNRVEVGVIPTHKGRVSSSGLDKDGFIKGARGVLALSPFATFELVLGELNELSADKAMSLPRQIDYFEMEYSIQISDEHSLEFGLERVLDENYMKSEYRFDFDSTSFLAAEVIHHIGNSSTLVVGFSSESVLKGRLIDVSVIYSYVSQSFGLRGELIEDFIGKGHGLSLEMKSPISKGTFDGLLRLDSTAGSFRFLFGLRASF